MEGSIYVIHRRAYRAGYWIGGVSGSLGIPANWSDGVVPSSGTAVIDSWATAALTNPEGSTFTPESISFPEGSAMIAISGDGAISGLSAITNNAAKHHVFNVPVSFSDGVTASISMVGANYMDFAGGVTMADIVVVGGAMFKGRFTINKSGDFTLNVAWTVMSGSELNYPNVVWYSHNHNLTVESNATVRVKGTKIQHSSSKTLVNVNDGTFVVSGSMRFNGSGGNPTHYFASGTGVLIANQIDAENGCRYCPPGHTVVGPGGIQLNGNSWIRVSNGPATHKFGAYADWEINPTVASNPAIYKNNSTTSCSLIFDTSDYYDPSVQRTITVRGPIGAGNADSLSAAVTGIGTFVFAFTNENNYASTFSGVSWWNRDGQVAITGSSSQDVWSGNIETTTEDIQAFVNTSMTGSMTWLGAGTTFTAKYATLDRIGMSHAYALLRRHRRDRWNNHRKASRVRRDENTGRKLAMATLLPQLRRY